MIEQQDLDRSDGNVQSEIDPGVLDSQPKDILLPLDLLDIAQEWVRLEGFQFDKNTLLLLQV
jgi:hypothetical protein